jgi:hypothetical protein
MTKPGFLLREPWLIRKLDFYKWLTILADVEALVQLDAIGS